MYSSARFSVSCNIESEPLIVIIVTSTGFTLHPKQKLTTSMKTKNDFIDLLQFYNSSLESRKKKTYVEVILY